MTSFQLKTTVYGKRACLEYGISWMDLSPGQFKPKIIQLVLVTSS